MNCCHLNIEVLLFTGQNVIVNDPVNAAAVVGSDAHFNVTATFDETNEAFVWKFESLTSGFDGNIYNSRDGKSSSTFNKMFITC